MRRILLTRHAFGALAKELVYSFIQSQMDIFIYLFYIFYFVLFQLFYSILCYLLSFFDNQNFLLLFFHLFCDNLPCSGMFRNVPECSGMFHVPGFVDARSRASICCEHQIPRATYHTIAPLTEEVCYLNRTYKLKMT